jgi:radical SAM protein with 4Fe4S-binding SPASM domain
MFRTLKSPLNIQIEVTESCDNCCRHCYNFFRHNNYDCKTMNFEQLDKIVQELALFQVPKVTITGGEPLLALEESLYLTKKLSEHGIGVNLNSNLVNFNYQTGLKFRDAGIASIVTSLVSNEPDLHDYITQNPGSWFKTVVGIKTAINLGFRVIVNMVLTKWNFHTLQQTGDFVGTLGIDKFGATRACAPSPIASDFIPNMITTNELQESIDILYRLKEKWGYKVDVLEHYPWCALQDIDKYKYLARRKCSAGITGATIGADGQLRPCGHSSMTYGNVLREGIQVPWFRMGDWRKQEYSGECSSCDYFSMCTGGCPVEIQNSPTKKDHHCSDGKDVVFTPEKKFSLDLSFETTFEFFPNTVLREEEFGGIVVSSTSGAMLADKKTFDILNVLYNKKYFTIQDIVDTFKVDGESTERFVSKLVKHNLVKERGRI